MRYFYYHPFINKGTEDQKVCYLPKTTELVNIECGI